MNNFAQLILDIPAVLIAMVASGFGHALFAHLMGDDTPKYNGQLSISPLAHVDPIGFIFMIIAKFGWNKPVIINPNNFKNRKIGLAVYFIAGSFSNMITAIIFLWIVKLLSMFQVDFETLYIVLIAIVQVNIIYAAIQLIPIPPFSGYYFIRELLPYDISKNFAIIERYSMLIFLLLIMTGLTSVIVNPILRAISIFVGVVTGINV